MSLGMRLCLLGIIAVTTLVGCRRGGDRFERKIEAGTAGGYTVWRGRMAGDFTLAERKEFDDAVQEVKYAIMRAGKVSGPDAIDHAWRTTIDQRTIREVMRLGYEARFSRLDQSRIELVTAMERNATLKTKPGDDESVAYLVRFREQQEERLRGIEREISATEQKLRTLVGGSAAGDFSADDKTEQPVMIPTPRK